MVIRALYAGDGPAKGTGGYLISVMKRSGIDYDHFPPSRISEIPSSLNQLSKYDVIILSDVPSSSLGKKRMNSLKEYVGDGGGLGMIGGWESFTGLIGNYKGTPVEEVLPVSCMPSDDRVNDSNGFKIIRKRNHPILEGLPGYDSPTVCGYNKVVPKGGSEILLTLKRIEPILAENRMTDRVDGIRLDEEEHPLLIVHRYKKGKSSAFTTDIAPHWVGGLVDWGSNRIRIEGRELGDKYIQFLYQMLRWLARA